MQNDDVNERRVGGTDKKAFRGKSLFELRVDFKLEDLQKVHHANETRETDLHDFSRAQLSLALIRNENVQGRED